LEIGIHLQNEWIRKKETWVDEITRDVRTLLKTAGWKRWTLEGEICGTKFENSGTVLLLLSLLLVVVIIAAAAAIAAAVVIVVVE